MPPNDELAFIVEMMRQMSRHTEPQEMVRAYMSRMGQMFPTDGFVSLSRRGLERPRVRITRASVWGTEVNPWSAAAPRVIHDRGLFSRLIWSDEPAVLDEIDLPADDPAGPFLEGMHSAMALPLYDNGVAMNMIIALRRGAAAFDRAQVPQRLWVSNLFGRATHSLVLNEQLREANEAMDRELKVVGDIQHALLPARLPGIAGVKLAVHYKTSMRAGGDYYDFFPLPGADDAAADSPAGRWGILIADVSGHGTPAAVIMAVTHSIAHTHNGPPAPPSLLMSFVNRHLAARYTRDNGTFVTAFYGIYDPASRRMTYASAGHPPPRVRRKDGPIEDAFVHADVPLGIDAHAPYRDGVAQFEAGDLLVMYTDGVTEARQHGQRSGQMFGLERLDEAIATAPAGAGGEGDNAEAALAHILQRLEDFSGAQRPADDQTLLVGAFE